MIRISGVSRRLKPAIMVVAGLTVAVGASSATGSGALLAQAQPCGLLTSEEIQALAPNQQVRAGTVREVPALDSSTCRYTWGEGIGQYSLAVSINPAARVFAGMNADAIRQYLSNAIAPATTDEAISDVGEGAVFKSDSSVYATASAHVKGRVLQVTLDGVDARDRKGQLIALLKSAASRL